MRVIGHKSRIMLFLAQVINMKIDRNRKSGFTLIEIIITLLLIVIFFGLIMGITQFSLAFFRNEDSQLTSQSSLRLIATQFEKDVRRNVVTKDDFDTITLGQKYQISVDDSSPIIYEFVDKKVYRDSILIGENVDEFILNWDEVKMQFDLVFRSFADGYGRKNEVVVRIVIRTGKGG